MMISVGKLCLLILAFASLSAAVGQLKVAHEWRNINYTWGSNSQRQQAVKSKLYDYKKIYIHDVQPLPNGGVLVTLPKRFANNPASLALISKSNSSAGPLLSPYPSWGHHTAKNCTGITSINRIALDDYNRVWGIDTGIIAGRRVCRAKLYSFDIKTNVVSQIIDIPHAVSLGSTLEVYAVDTRGSRLNRDSTTLYISDITKNGFIVWDGSTFFRRTHELFYGSAHDPIISVGGYDLDTDLYGRGISFVAVPPGGIFNQDLILFKDLTTMRGYFAARSQLTDPKVKRVNFYETDIVLPNNVLISVSSADGVKFGGAAAAMSLICWNMLNPLYPNYMHLWETDEKNLQFISSIKFIQGKHGEEIWITTNRLTKLLAGAMDFQDYNFRIVTANVAKLIAGTICDPKLAVRRRNVTTCHGIEDDAIHSAFHLVE